MFNKALSLEARSLNDRLPILAHKYFVRSAIMKVVYRMICSSRQFGIQLASQPDLSKIKLTRRAFCHLELFSSGIFHSTEKQKDAPHSC